MNAAKFTPRGGRIGLIVKRSPDYLAITVSDTGVGFDPASTPALFEMFSQAHAEVEGAEGGLGIGLSLVKGLVNLHGGSVRADSRGAGLGAEFTIEIPSSMILDRPTPTATADPVPTADAPSGCRVLVVDDNRDAADSLGMLLEFSGHEVRIAYSGGQALTTGEEYRPDIAILDIGMPDMDGYEVARRARSSQWGARVILIALTGWGQESDKQAALAGVSIGISPNRSIPMSSRNSSRAVWLLAGNQYLPREAPRFASEIPSACYHTERSAAWQRPRM